MTTELHNATLEWAAEWIEGSIKGESNERVREFAGNMAMTFRAAKIDTLTPAASVAPTVDGWIGVDMSLPRPAQQVEVWYGDFVALEHWPESRDLAACRARGITHWRAFYPPAAASLTAKPDETKPQTGEVFAGQKFEEPK